MSEFTHKEPMQGLLPVKAYTTQEWFDKEKRELFGKSWNYAGMVTDLPNYGDYMTIQVGSYPIFIIRGEDNALHAYHALCRHRGAQLLRARGNKKKCIVCPYHNWSYSIGGDLLNIPQEKTQYQDQAIDKSALGLHKASLAIWRGMLFVHPDKNAPSFEEWLDDVPNHMGPHIPEKLVEYKDAQMEYTVDANWKILVENFIDGYHLQHLHAQTLNMYKHSQQQWSFQGRHWVFYEPPTEEYKKVLHSASAFPVIDHVPEEKYGAFLQVYFPNFGVIETESSWSTFEVIPIAPEKTQLKIRVWAMPMSKVKQYTQLWKYYGYWSDKMKKPKDGYDPDDPLHSGDFMKEDIFACEQQQLAMHSPLYSSGPFAKDEQSILHFQQHILNALSNEKGISNPST